MTNQILIAIGNSARGDDGLGWAFAEALEQQGGFAGDIVYRYQLQVEDAELISRYRRVVFVDAWQGTGPDVKCVACTPVPAFSYTTHKVEPEALLHLCADLYEAKPLARCLMIRGERWGLGDDISPQGIKGLENALRLFRERPAEIWSSTAIPAQ